jgi:DNA-binding CsgD family transcriptional regulator
MFDLLGSALATPHFGLAGDDAAGSMRLGLSIEALVCVLDEIDYGIIIVDVNRYICHANHLARHEMRMQRALSDVGQTLCAADRNQSAQLSQAISNAGNGHRSMLNLGDAEHGISVVCVPLLRAVEHDTGAVAEILLVCGKRQPCDNLTMQFFARSRKLSAGEETVLHGLCAGLKAEEIACQNGVRESTVRSQITSIRRKTGTSSTRQLVNLVASLPPMVSALRRTALQ